MPICSITGDTNFDHFSKVISVSFSIVNLTNFPFVVNKYLIVELSGSSQILPTKF